MRVKDGFEFSNIHYPFNQDRALRIIDKLHSIDEYVEYINSYEIKEAEIIMPSLAFLDKCPTLKRIKISPVSTAEQKFDFSTIHRSLELESLNCINEFCFLEKREMSQAVDIDCSKFSNLKYLSISANRGSINYENLDSLQTLIVGGYNNAEGNLKGMFSSKIVDTLQLNECGERSLDGIEISEKMQCLYLSYNRKLEDISALAKVKSTLKALRIVNCAKIKDFSILNELENLELLEVWGTNSLPDLKFLNNLKKLKTFIFNVNILDGDLTPCLNLSYVYCGKSKKYYNLSDKDLPKGMYIRGNESIEEWRRLE